MTTTVDKRCTCFGPGNYNRECPVGTAPHFVRAVSSPEDHDLYIKIEVVEYTAFGNHPVQVFLFYVENGDCTWPESFGSREAADAFMTGMKVCLSMSGLFMRQHLIPQNAHRATHQRTERES